MVCSCGYREKSKESLILKEDIKESKAEKIEVVDKKVDVLPKIKEDCPKCGYTEAYYWLVQTRSADEAPTRFFKCVKCNHNWRSYD